MKGTILQPTYLPWLGYFDMIDVTDIYVVFDHVQFVKKSWQQRNRIKTHNGELMLTVPVKKATLNTDILLGVDGGVNKPYSGTSYNYVNRAGYPNQCGVPGGGDDDLVFPDNGPLSGQIITVSDDHPIFRIGALAWGYTGDNKNIVFFKS